jgi:uncharacterized OB-fold protein
MNSPVKIWRNQKYIASMLGREGTIVSWTVIRVPPGGFSSLAPYPVVVVDLVGDIRITAQLVDPPARLDSAERVGEADWMENLVGMRVRVVVRRISEPTTEGVIPYGIKVKPV